MSEPQLEVRHRTVMDDESRHVARVYAEALYKAAEADGQVPTLLEELDTLTEGVFQQDPGLELFFASAAVGRDRKAELIKKAFEGKSSPAFARFLGVLNEHDRLDMLRPISNAFRTIHDRKTHKIVVHVKSAVPLTDEERGRLIADVKSLGQLEPVLDEVVDPEILGGLVIRVHDWVYDASVRSRIQAVRNQLIERSSHGIQSGRDRFGS
jgi:F-type H+-transporting ATPase subunit delta